MFNTMTIYNYYHAQSNYVLLSKFAKYNAKPKRIISIANSAILPLRETFSCKIETSKEIQLSEDAYKNEIPPVNLQFTSGSQVVCKQAIMHFNACFLFFLLGFTLIQASPTPKVIEEKILPDNIKTEAKTEKLEIEETGEDKERSKKAAVCLQLESAYPQPAQLASNDNQLAVQSIPLAVQAPVFPQQLQALNFVRPVAPSLPQPNFVIPQPMVQPLQTLQLLPSQPCPQPPSVNIITSGQPNAVPPATPPPAAEAEIIPEPPKPAEPQPEPLPAPQENIALIPPASICEHVMILPEPEPVNYVTVPQVPCTNPLHGRVTECTCQKVESEPQAFLPLIRYPVGYGRSAMMIARHTVPNGEMGATPDARSKAFININTRYPSYYPHHQNVYQKMHVHGLEGMREVGGGYTAPVTIAGYPQFFRSSGPLQPLQAMPENINPPMEEYIRIKAPREINSIELSPEKAEETKQQEGKAMLIDGRRNTRSNKEENVEPEKQPVKS